MYRCEKCDFETPYESHYNRHIRTSKHVIYVCEKCKKTYKTRSGLWKHKHTCTEHNNEKINKLTKLLEETVAKQENLFTDIIPKLETSNTMTTTINNRISINVFLNNQCGNAVNFNEFLQELNVTVDDLIATKESGYVNGISNIFIKHLNLLETTERPIHCSDKKRLQFYIKDEDKWDKGEIEKVENAISTVAQKQIMQIKEWERQHPNWNTNARETDEYLGLLKVVMGGSTNKEQQKNNKNIVKKLGNELYFLKKQSIGI